MSFLIWISSFSSTSEVASVFGGEAAPDLQLKRVTPLGAAQDYDVLWKMT